MMKSMLLNWLYVYDSSEGKKWQGSPNIKPSKDKMKVDDRVMTANHSSGTITKLEDDYCYVDLDLYGKVKKFSYLELRPWHRSREYMIARNESDMIFSVDDSDGVPVIILGKIVDERIRSEIRAIKDKELMIARIKELRRQIQADLLNPVLYSSDNNKREKGENNAESNGSD